MAKLTNKVISVLTDKVQETLKDNRSKLLDSPAFKLKKLKLEKEFNTKKLYKLIELRDFQNTEINKTNAEIRKYTSKLPNLYTITVNGVEDRLNTMLLQDYKQVSSKDIEAEIIMSNDSDLNVLLEQLVSKFSIK